MGGLEAGDRARLLHLARGAIEQALADEVAEWAPPPELSPVLARPGACFVTLRLGGALRGCVGSIEPRRALAVDAAMNARAAATGDPRFTPLVPDELAHVRISLSILGPLVPVRLSTRAAFEEALVPGVDGVVLAEHGRRATFLPAVWAGVAGPREFLDCLLVKMGRPARHWSDAMTAWTYGVESFGDTAGEG